MCGVEIIVDGIGIIPSHLKSVLAHCIKRRVKICFIFWHKTNCNSMIKFSIKYLAAINSALPYRPSVILQIRLFGRVGDNS